MFRDLMNHQKVFSPPRSFMNKLSKKITLNEYLVKRLNYDGIFIGFGTNKYNEYTPFYNFLRDREDFHIIQCDNDFLVPYCAKSYHKNTNKTGIMFSSCRYGYTKLIPGILRANEESAPLLLISFYLVGRRILHRKFVPMFLNLIYFQ